jgi:glycosyltransferase involved in cell wall biosynthesis
MRVAYICADPGIPVRGSKGAAIHLQQIVRAFRRRGDEVTVYCTRMGDAAAETLGDVPVVSFPVARGDAAASERAVTAASAEIAARVAADGCDLVYERYSLFSDAAARIGRPSVVEVNAPLVEEQRTHRTLVDEDTAVAMTRSLFACASVVSCVSEPVADWARGHCAGELCDGVGSRLIVAPNGVDTRTFTPSGVGDGPLQAVFVGSLKPWHGVEFAIEAVAGLEGVVLTIVGDGPERSRLEEHAERVGAAVRWLGSVPHRFIPVVLSRMHAGLAPYPASADDYFSPLKAYEYLAAGLPVVASATGQLPSLVEHGRTGLLVAPGDAAALREALGVLRDDRALARRLGAAARARAVSRHDWDRTLETILIAAGTDTDVERARNELGDEIRGFCPDVERARNGLGDEIRGFCPDVERARNGLGDEIRGFCPDVERARNERDETGRRRPGRSPRFDSLRSLDDRREGTR